MAVEAIHGNKSQGARQRALKRFRDGDARVLVATDIAARGIDVDGVTHIINFELPNEPESYVHRIGRTARAGAGGVALSFCDPAERAYLRDIEALIRRRLTVIGDQPAAAPDERGQAKAPHGEPRGKSRGESWGKPQGEPRGERRHKRRRPRPTAANANAHPNGARPNAARRRKRAA